MCSLFTKSVKARVRLEYWISFCRVVTSAMLRGKSPRALQRSTWNTSASGSRSSVTRVFVTSHWNGVFETRPPSQVMFALDLDGREGGR